jgi:hypothetical protein
MKRQNNPIRLYIICWGILSLIGGSCLIAVSFWGDKFSEWVGLIPCICAVLMMFLLRMAIREADGAKNVKWIRFPVKKISRIVLGERRHGKTQVS